MDKGELFFMILMGLLVWLVPSFIVEMECEKCKKLKPLWRVKFFSKRGSVMPDALICHSCSKKALAQGYTVYKKPIWFLDMFVDF